MYTQKYSYMYKYIYIKWLMPPPPSRVSDDDGAERAEDDDHRGWPPTILGRVATSMGVSNKESMSGMRPEPQLVGIV